MKILSILDPFHPEVKQDFPLELQGWTTTGHARCRSRHMNRTQGDWESRTRQWFPYWTTVTWGMLLTGWDRGHEAAFNSHSHETTLSSCLPLHLIHSPPSRFCHKWRMSWLLPHCTTPIHLQNKEESNYKKKWECNYQCISRGLQPFYLLSTLHPPESPPMSSLSLQAPHVWVGRMASQAIFIQLLHATPHFLPF